MKLKHVKIHFPIILLSAAFSISCSSDEEIQTPIDKSYISIPDVEFESKLIELNIDSDGIINHRILTSDAKRVTRLNLNGSSNTKKINDLTGLQGFKNITLLSVSEQNLEKVDLTSNTKLDTLLLGGNQLTSIDLSNNTNLVLLDLQANFINNLTGISRAEHLKSMNLSFNDFIDVSINNNSLEDLLLSHNLLKNININNAVSLKNVILTSNQLTSINIYNNSAIETLLISDNKLSNINLENNSNLTHLYISNNSLTSLDVSKTQLLLDLRADRNPNLSCIKVFSNQVIPNLSLSEYQEINTQCD